MSWFATDDRFWSHRKVMRLRRSEYYAQAVAVWCLAGSWCSGDDSAKHTGHVHYDVIAGLGLRDWELGVKALVEARLFDETADPEVVAFHDWEFWNGPGAKTKRLEKRLEADRARQRMRRSGGLDESVSRDQSSDQGGLSRDHHVTQGKGVGEGGGVESSEQNSTKKSSRRKRDINEGREDARRLCEHLADRIEANGSERPTITVRWLDAARLLVDRTDVTEEQVHRAIDWCQDSGFWQSNIMSMPKLREKFDQLRLKAKAERNQERTGGAKSPPRHVDAALARDVAAPEYDPIAARLNGQQTLIGDPA